MPASAPTGRRLTLSLTSCGRRDADASTTERDHQTARTGRYVAGISGQLRPQHIHQAPRHAGRISRDAAQWNYASVAAIARPRGRHNILVHCSDSHAFTRRTISGSVQGRPVRLQRAVPPVTWVWTPPDLLPRSSCTRKALGPSTTISSDRPPEPSRLIRLSCGLMTTGACVFVSCSRRLSATCCATSKGVLSSSNIPTSLSPSPAEADMVRGVW